jgi:hypothetical protein
MVPLEGSPLAVLALPARDRIILPTLMLTVPDKPPRIMNQPVILRYAKSQGAGDIEVVC